MVTAIHAAGVTNHRNIRRYILAGGSVALLGALAYQAYQSDVYGRSKRYLTKLYAAIQRYTDALATGGEICSSILSDLQQFLESEGNEVPPSLKQVSKLLQSEEFTSTTSTTVSAIYQGIAGSSSSSNDNNDLSAGHHASRTLNQPTSTVDKIIDALLSHRGHSLVSVAVSMASKNIVSAYMEAQNTAQNTTDEDSNNTTSTTSKVFDFLSSHEGQHLVIMAIAAFASNGMRVYMDKSLEVNFYEDLFKSMAKPQHLEVVKQCIGIFARDVVGAYLQGSRPVSRNNSTCALIETENPSHHQEIASAAVSVELQSQNDDEAAADTASPMPSITSTRSPTTIEALRNNNDDLDSDSLLHSRKRKDTAKSKSKAHSNEWIAAVGKEWINAAKDPDGRHAMAQIVGTATREVVGGVSQVVFERFSVVFLVMVLLMGVLSAIIFQGLLAVVV